jgi:hypothetical protein
MLLQARENLGLCSDSIRDRHKLQWSSQGDNLTPRPFLLEKISKNIFFEGNIVQSNDRFQSEHWPDRIIYDVPTNKDL